MINPFVYGTESLESIPIISSNFHLHNTIHFFRFKSTLRGHVGALYQLSWAPDSRLLVTGSRDSTLKLWNPATGKLEGDLPGHRDEVFTVDWATDGQHVATGSYDRTIKIWQH